MGPRKAITTSAAPTSMLSTPVSPRGPLRELRAAEMLALHCEGLVCWTQGPRAATPSTSTLATTNLEAIATKSSLARRLAQLRALGQIVLAKARGRNRVQA